ncbi:hypothetical protein Taro_050646, partial [Colocasia esculenta]|nr:hypothetical protein [Colocasia esculenta]
MQVLVFTVYRLWHSGGLQIYASVGVYDYFEMAGVDKSWMNVTDRLDPMYEKGVEELLDFAFHEDRRSFRHGDNRQLIQCPCKKCCNGLKFTRYEVKTHLICDEILLHYTNWVCHGEEPVGDISSKEINEEEQQMTADNTI